MLPLILISSPILHMELVNTLIFLNVLFILAMYLSHSRYSLDGLWPHHEFRCPGAKQSLSNERVGLAVFNSYCYCLAFNSLWPGRFQWTFRWVLFKPITEIDGWDTCCEIALRRMSLDLTDDKSTLVQVMAWCRQATSHYMSPGWPSFLSPYGVTRP